MDQELTYKWIQERLRELNSGNLSEKDRLRLVEIARTDPFVADALEGFHAHPDEEHDLYLRKLTEKIHPTRRPRRRWLIPNLTVTAIAASVFLIIATYAVIVRLENEPEESVLVLVTPDSLLMNDSIAPAVAMETDVRIVEENTPGDTKSSPPVSKERPAQPEARSSVSKTTPSTPDNATGSSAATSVTTSEPSSASDAEMAMPAAAPPADDQKAVTEDLALQSRAEKATAKRDEGYFANQMDPAVMASRVTGRVVAASTGAPLTNATLAVSYTNQLFHSDTDGYFELSLPEDEAVLHVTVGGFADSTLVIKQGEENIVVQLSEGVLSPQVIVPSAANKGPVPSSRNPAIESYFTIRNHITATSTLQLTTTPSNARRKVIVEFKVSNNGRPTAINVLESSRDKSYDGEAVRLIQSSPDWVCPGGTYPCMRRYTFYFR